MASSEDSVDELVDSLAYVLARSLPLLRRLAAKPKHMPGDEEYRAIAKRQVEHLKLTGVERIIRRHVAAAQSWPPRDPPARRDVAP
jgi:hypothetical protein